MSGRLGVLAVVRNVDVSVAFDHYDVLLPLSLPSREGHHDYVGYFQQSKTGEE